ncbi:hypothetical protein TL16_g07619 [Triparma laevis f. inornata]|uniref:Prenylcysteine lyase domain-containing protein n=1 Tax=Triparma laevis f. inornata TaxID=1714386 RepID=A0A9W7AUL4_9STRA|nr:hypothetical protein TL16_g07619 [Triparma laevis f. inornata]
MAGRLITTSKKSYTPWNPENRLRVERDIAAARVEAEKKKEDDADQVINALRHGSELASKKKSNTDPTDLDDPSKSFTLFPQDKGKKRIRNEVNPAPTGTITVKHPKTGKIKEGVSILSEPIKPFTPEVNNKEAYDRREESRKSTSDPASMFMKIKPRPKKETLEERARREHDEEKKEKKEKKRLEKKEKKREKKDAKKEMKRLKKERGSQPAFKLDRAPTHTALILQTIVIITISLLMSPASSQRIAIIGAGVGGSYVSQFLSESTHPFNTHIFESTSSPGGRVKSTLIPFSDSETTVELGASIAYGGNHYISSYADKLGLNKITPSEDNPKNTFGIYDCSTSSFLFRQSKSLPESWFFKDYLPNFVNNLLVEMYRKVEIFLRFQETLNPLFSYVKEAASSLDELYSKLNGGETFDDCVGVWEAIGTCRNCNNVEILLTPLTPPPDLSKYLNNSFTDFFKSKISSTSTTLLTQLSTAVNRVNYNHRTETLPTLVSLISHVPIVYGDLFAIEGGNVRLLETLASSASVLNLNTKVGLVVFNPQLNTFNLYDDSGKRLGEFDKVVLASPVQQSHNIEFKIQSMVDPTVLMNLYFDNGGEFEDIEESTVTMTKKNFHNSRTETEYITTVTTVVEGSRVKIEEFGGQGEVPESIYFAT